MADDTQPILDYTARDFDSIRSMLVGLGQGLFPEWKTIGEANDFGTLLLELYAYMGDVQNFYIDRVSSEAFLGTAQRRQSMLYIAEQQGYQPIGQRAAIVTLLFTLDAGFTADTDEVPGAVVPAGTRVYTTAESSADIVYFETDYSISLLAGQTVSVSATEGRTNVYTVGASTGAPNQTFQIPDLGVIEGSVSVRSLEGTYQYNNINEDVPQWVNYYEVPTIAAARGNQSVYSTYIDDKGYTYVLFGDSGSGRIPPVGAQIEITYRYGRGSNGNVVESGKLENLDEASGLPTPYFKVTNPESPAGGADPESLASMRFSIPKGAQIRERAVTVEDYQSLALQVSGIAKAVAFGQVYSAVNVRIAPVGGNLDSELTMRILRESVQTYLEPRILIGSKVYVENARWTDIWIVMELYVLDGFPQEGTKNAVEQAIRSYLAFDNMDLGKDVHVGEIYRRAMRVEGVDWIDLVALNSIGARTVSIANIVVPFDSIARIAPDTGVDTTSDTTDDTSGLVVNPHGGTNPAAGT